MRTDKWLKYYFEKEMSHNSRNLWSRISVVSKTMMMCYSLRYISTYMQVHERTHVLRTHMMLRKI